LACGRRVGRSLGCRFSRSLGRGFSRDFGGRFGSDFSRGFGGRFGGRRGGYRSRSAGLFGLNQVVTDFEGSTKRERGKFGHGFHNGLHLPRKRWLRLLEIRG